jgi:hypothetical protein
MQPARQHHAVRLRAEGPMLAALSHLKEHLAAPKWLRFAALQHTGSCRAFS